MKKNLLKFIKFLLTGIPWSLFYFTLLRFFMFWGWKFDFADKNHWLFLRERWEGGWAITEPLEYAFLFTLVFAIPLWLGGWRFLFKVQYVKILIAVVGWPRRKYLKRKAEELKNKPITIKRKSHALSRPVPVRATSGKVLEHAPKEEEKKKPSSSPVPAEVKPSPEEETKKSSAPIMNDDELLALLEEGETSKKPETFKDDLPEFESYAPKKTAPPSEPVAGGSSEEIIRNAGYDIISGRSLNDEKVDFVGIGEEAILLIQAYRDEGSWLAEEAPVRADEGAYWFSETTQKASPVQALVKIRDEIKEIFEGVDRPMHIYTFLLVTKAHIINAEDIREAWDQIDVRVCASEENPQRGELPLFSTVIPKNESKKVSSEIRAAMRLILD